MKTACFIPIKSQSERVKGKNFRLVAGEPLYKIIIRKAVASESFTKIFVDTDSDEIAHFAETAGATYIPRRPELAVASANGNDLIVHHFLSEPDFDYYFQLFATAPLLRVTTITRAVSALLHSAEHDSVLTAIPHYGFFWRQGMPVSYRPDLSPRTQDLVPIEEETTGLYGIAKAALDKYRCRIGAKPIIYHVSKLESIDLNTDDDFAYLEWLVETHRASLVD